MARKLISLRRRPRRTPSLDVEKPRRLTPEERERALASLRGAVFVQVQHGGKSLLPPEVREIMGDEFKDVEWVDVYKPQR